MNLKISLKDINSHFEIYEEDGTFKVMRVGASPDEKMIKDDVTLIDAIDHCLTLLNRQPLKESL